MLSVISPWLRCITIVLSLWRNTLHAIPILGFHLITLPSNFVADAEPILNNDMMLTQSVSLPLEESCRDTGQKDLEADDTTVSGDKNCRQTAMPSTNSESF
jgi:hypothetical protein